MKQINLVPVTILHKAEQQRLGALLAFACLAAIILVGFLWMVSRTEAATLNSKVATTEQQPNAPQATEDPTISDLKQRITTLNTLASTDIDWNKGFALVSSVTPQEVSLNDYNFSVVASGVQLHMSGEAPSNVSFADFVESLEQSKVFVAKSVKVDSYSYVPATQSVNFAVEGLVLTQELTYSK